MSAKRAPRTLPPLKACARKPHGLTSPCTLVEQPRRPPPPAWGAWTCGAGEARLLGEQQAVGRQTGVQAVAGRRVEQVEEVFPHQGLAAGEAQTERPQTCQVAEETVQLGEGERVVVARQFAGEAVQTGEVAGGD